VTPAEHLRRGQELLDQADATAAAKWEIRYATAVVAQAHFQAAQALAEIAHLERLDNPQVRVNPSEEILSWPTS